MKRRSKWLPVLAIALIAGGLIWWFNRSPLPAQGKLGHAAYGHTRQILAIGPRPAGSEALTKVRAYVKGELEKSGWSVQEQPFKRDTPVGEIAFVNLRARFAQKGTDPWAGVPEGVLCAHIDSKAIPGIEFLGADDAASACGAIVEMARFLAEHKPAQAARLELVFFDGEEGFGEHMTMTNGLFGSNAYVALWRNRPQKPRFGILLDMIGHKDLRILLPSDSPAPLKDHVMAAANEEEAAKHFSLSADPILDDHVPLNLIGIPTIDLIGDFEHTRWWHNAHGASDDLSIISADSLDISMRVTLRTLDRLLDKNAPAQ